MSGDNKFTLPSGYYVSDATYNWQNYIGGDAVVDWETEITKTEDKSKYGPQCECGTTITLGKADDPEFHSDWCPLYKKRENK